MFLAVNALWQTLNYLQYLYIIQSPRIRVHDNNAVYSHTLALCLALSLTLALCYYFSISAANIISTYFYLYKYLLIQPAAFAFACCRFPPGRQVI